MKCTNCGGEIPAAARFCPACGQPAPSKPRFCMHCGKPLEGDMLFCESCGSRVQPAENTSAPSAAEGVELPAPGQTPAQPPEPAPVQQPVQAAPAQAPVQIPAQPPASAAFQAPPVFQTPGAASAGAGVAQAVGQMAAGGVKRASHVGRTVAIWTVVAAFLLGLATACVSYFAHGPEETVESFFDSVVSMDYEGMLGCVDPGTEKQIRAVMGITGDLFGAITGIGLDFEDLAALAPMFAPEVDASLVDIGGVETVLYSDASEKKIAEICRKANNGGSIGEGYQSDNAIIEFLQEYKIVIPGLEKLLAKTAVVKLTAAETGEVLYIPMVNAGWGDWRILVGDLFSSFVS